MIYPGLIGPSNPTQSALVSERLVNWYVERASVPGSPEPYILLPTPGQDTFATVSDTGTRGALAIDGRCWIVVGTGFYELFSDGTSTRHGSVADDNYPVTISYNPAATGAELFITSGGNGYTCNTTTNALTLVLSGEATMGGFLNNRYLAFNLNTGVVKISGLNDATFTEFFTRSIAPDPWQTMLVGNREIWLIGEQTGEVWYDTGAVPQPFAPIPGAFFTTGIAAPFCAGMAGEQVVWLSNSKFGGGRVVAARGYTPQVISNDGVDTAIAMCAREGSLASTEVMVYEQEGHLFAVFSFPTANCTWVVDLESGAWHERGTHNVDQGRYDAWRPRVHVFAFNKHLVGERTTGVISDLDVMHGTEADGGPIRRLRVAPPLWVAPNQRGLVSRLELLMDSGLGTEAGQGVNPKVQLRTSTNGRTWSAERHATAGRMGQYDHRVVFTRLGSTEKIFVPEIVVTDPVPMRLVGANIEASGFVMGRNAA